MVILDSVFKLFVQIKFMRASSENVHEESTMTMYYGIS